MLRCKNCKHPASSTSASCTSCGQDFNSPSGVKAAFGVGVVVSLLLFFDLDRLHPSNFTDSDFGRHIIAGMIMMAPILAGVVAYFVVAEKSQDRQIEDV